MDVITILAWLVLLAASALSGMAGAAVAVRMTAKRMKVAVEQPNVERLLVQVNVREGDDSIRASWEVNVDGAAITAGVVERWLDRRGLVMVPAGADFKPAVGRGVKA